MNTKQCSRCKQDKPIEQFGEYKKNRVGLRCWCKTCYKEYLHIYHQKNKEYANERDRLWYHEHEDENKRRSKEWRRNNKEHSKEYFHNLHINNREERNEYRRKDYRQKTEKYKKNARNYRKTEPGKNNKKQSDAKRDRDKKWIPILPNIFPEEIPVAYHHIEGKWFVAPIPLILHKGGPNLKNHIETCNEWIEFYYEIKPMTFLEEK